MIVCANIFFISVVNTSFPRCCIFVTIVLITAITDFVGSSNVNADLKGLISYWMDIAAVLNNERAKSRGNRIRSERFRVGIVTFGYTEEGC